MTGLLRKVRLLEQHELRPGYDVVIVGGGVNGLSLAYHLAEVHGIRDVAVLARFYLRSGASGRNPQVLRANYNTPETVPLYEASLRMYRTLSQELDFNVLFTDQGELDLCHTADSLQVEREKSLLNRALGVQTDILTPEEALKVCPLVDLTGGGELPVVGASYHPPSAIARDAAVVWGHAAEVDARDVRCAGVRAGAGPVAAGHVVSAVAGHTSVVAAMAGVRVPISTY